MPLYTCNIQENLYHLFYRVPFFKVARMALTGPFTYYLDLIIDSFLLANFVKALDGVGNIIENYRSFPSTVSINLCYTIHNTYSEVLGATTDLNPCQ